MVHFINERLPPASIRKEKELCNRLMSDKAYLAKNGLANFDLISRELASKLVRKNIRRRSTVNPDGTWNIDFLLERAFEHGFFASEYLMSIKVDPTTGRITGDEYKLNRFSTSTKQQLNLCALNIDLISSYSEKMEFTDESMFASTLFTDIIESINSLGIDQETVKMQTNTTKQIFGKLNEASANILKYVGPYAHFSLENMRTMATVREKYQLLPRTPPRDEMRWNPKSLVTREFYISEPDVAALEGWLVHTYMNSVLPLICKLNVISHIHLNLESRKHREKLPEGTAQAYARLFNRLEMLSLIATLIFDMPYLVTTKRVGMTVNIGRVASGMAHKCVETVARDEAPGNGDSFTEQQIFKMILKSAFDIANLLAEKKEDIKGARTSEMRSSQMVLLDLAASVMAEVYD